MASYSEFVELVDKLFSDIEAKNSKHGTSEWYLRNHMYSLVENCHNSNSALEVSNSLKSLTRFATESLNWDSYFSKEVFRISEYHSNLIKRVN